MKIYKGRPETIKFFKQNSKTIEVRGSSSRLTSSVSTIDHALREFSRRRIRKSCILGKKFVP